MKFKKFIKYFIEYFFLICITYTLRLFPVKINLIFAKSLGKFLYNVNKKHRIRAYNNLKYAFPEKSKEELNQILKRVYINLCKVYFEFLSLSNINKKYIDAKIRIIGKENLDSALKLKKGIIAVTAHIDNWELLGTVIKKMGYKVSVVYHSMRNPYSDRFINNIREKAGIRLIEMKYALRPSLKALKENHLLGLIADQDAGGKGVFVDFFNRPASTAKGPAFFALKTSAPMLLFTFIRKKNDEHELYISKPFSVKKTGDEQKDIYYNTKLWSDELEKWVKKYPEQWFWVHRRWHTKKR